MSDKKSLRRELLRQRDSLPPGDRKAWDAAINRAVTGHAWFSEAQAVLGYYPIGSEPDIRPALEGALRLGKEVYLPCGDMAFRKVDSLDNLVPGKFGIPEPDQNNSPFSILHSPFSLCLVPGLAFDLDGYRLGYGKGYYDRFLEHFQGRTLGVCYECLLQAALPREAHDLTVDIVISD